MTTFCWGDTPHSFQVIKVIPQWPRDFDRLISRYRLTQTALCVGGNVCYYAALLCCRVGTGAVSRGAEENAVDDHGQLGDDAHYGCGGKRNGANH